MDIAFCEQKLCMLAYPKGCNWKLLETVPDQGTKCAVHWWSTNVRPQGDLFLITRISEMGQLASALMTEEILVDATQPNYFHYSKYVKYLHQVIHGLWNRDWTATVDAMHISRHSPIFQEWVSILDAYEGSDAFKNHHRQYLQRKALEAQQAKTKWK